MPKYRKAWIGLGFVGVMASFLLDLFITVGSGNEGNMPVSTNGFRLAEVFGVLLLLRQIQLARWERVVLSTAAATCAIAVLASLFLDSEYHFVQYYQRAMAMIVLFVSGAIGLQGKHEDDS